MVKSKPNLSSLSAGELRDVADVLLFVARDAIILNEAQRRQSAASLVVAAFLGDLADEKDFEK